MKSDLEKLNSDSRKLGFPEPFPAITLLDEFRIAIIAQTWPHEAFWADMAAEWWRDWKKRRIRKALVALHYGP